jgi:hypothetical protein
MMAGYYTQVKISVAPELAAAFKNVCHANDVSITGELSRFMAKRAGLPSAPASPLGTRRQRRRELAKLIERLELVLENERRYMDNIPENLQGSSVFEIAAQSVETLEEAVDILDSAYNRIEPNLRMVP